MKTTNASISFKLPQQLACPLPTEARGIARDAVRLMVSEGDGSRIQHSQFSELADFLEPSDVLVVNTSATIPAAIPVSLPSGEDGILHLGSPVDSSLNPFAMSQSNARPGPKGNQPHRSPEGHSEPREESYVPESFSKQRSSPKGDQQKLRSNKRVGFPLGLGRASAHWLIEIRQINKNATQRWKEGQAGMEFNLPGNGKLKLVQRFYDNDKLLDLWEAELHLPFGLLDYLAQHAHPIKYENLDRAYPLHYYQTYFSTHPGSSEMPSAGRGFTPELVNKLLTKGVQFAPILLHTGISSLEEDEHPYPEYMEISSLSAAILNQAKAQSRRVIAVGTTALRAVESAINAQGKVEAYNGHTALYVDRDYPLQIVGGLLTGFHEPKASHLHMLQALAGQQHIQRAYDSAILLEYGWHIFGDLHLILK